MTLTSENPFAAKSDLPYQLPPFDRVTEDHYLPAFEAGMAEQRAEVEAIAGNPEPPSFDNTLVALERSGQLLGRVSAAFFNLCSAHTNPVIQGIEAEIAPRLAAHRDAIHLDQRLFARIDQLHARRAELGLDPESDWLLQRYHVEFVRAGARLSEAEAEQLRVLNQQLASLQTAFGTRLLADTNDLAVRVADVSELDGLSEDAVSAAAEAGRALSDPAPYAISLILPSGQPQLAALHNRALRERIHQASVARGSRGNANDTTDIIRQIVKLRAQRAALMGYAHHAAYAIEDNTARTAEAASGMLAKLAPAAVANAANEAADLQAVIAAEGGDFQLAAWDWAYYTEKVRKQRYDIDEAELRPYFELERVLVDGVFFAANRFFGLTFAERHDLPTYHPEVRVWEVSDDDGPIGLFLGDFYTRGSKRGGAWMNNLVDQSHLMDAMPVVMNNLNINKPPAGEPTLLTLDEVRTLFHEFGHALHGLFSNVTYPKFSGTEVPQDFVEFPSQVNEVWMLWPEVLANYATHYQTGERLPQAVVDRLQEAEQFNQGFSTTEYLAASILDLAWHSLPPEAADIEDVAAFEADALGRAGVAVDVVPPRYGSHYFSHVFSGAAYSAGYYSYIWSEVLDADTVHWLRTSGGLTREAGDHFRAKLLSRGGSEDSMAVFRQFLGRDPQIDPLLRRRGLA